MVSANATGEHALPLMVIGKSKKPRCSKNVTQLPLTYRAQKSAWMNSYIFTGTKMSSCQMLKTTENKKKNEGKVLLIMDNTPIYPFIEVLNPIEQPPY